MYVFRYLRSWKYCTQTVHMISEVYSEEQTEMELFLMDYLFPSELFICEPLRPDHWVNGLKLRTGSV